MRSTNGRSMTRAALVAMLPILWTGGTSQAAGTDELKVVATIKPIHSLVARVMEGVGTPDVLISGAASPHAYAMKPSDAKAVNGAKVFFRVSEQIEPFTGKVVKSLPKEVQVVTLATAPGVTLLDARSGGTFEAHAHDDDHDDGAKKHHDHDHDHDAKKSTTKHDHDDDDHAHEARDHHIWLDPENAKAMVDEIARTLAAVAPEHGETFAANAAKLKTDLDGLAVEIDSALAPVRGRPFVVFHDAYQYFERRFGLDAAGSITVSPEVKPSAKRLKAIRSKIAKLGAVCVFAEPQYQPKLVAAVIEGTPSRTGTLDPEGASVEKGPDAYFQLLRQIKDGLKSCLSQSS